MKTYEMLIVAGAISLIVGIYRNQPIFFVLGAAFIAIGAVKLEPFK